MKVELTIKQGSLQTTIVIDGYHIMVEELLKVIKEAAHKIANCEIK